MPPRLATDQGLGDRERQQPSTGRSQCGAHGQLVTPARGAREQQRRRVGARDEEQQGDAPGDQQQRGSDRVHGLLGGRNQPRANDSVRGPLARHAGRERVELGRCLRERDPVGKAAEDLVVVRFFVDALGRRHPRRQPEVVVVGQRPRQRGAARHDADDGARFAIDLNGSSQHARVAAEAPPPEAIAEDCHRRRAVQVLSRCECPSNPRRDSEQRHQRCGHPRAADALRVLLAGQRERVRDGHRQLRQAMELVPRGEVEWRRFELHDVLRRQRLPDEDDARRIAVRERAEQDAVEQREDGAVDANAERQRQRDEHA